MKFCNSVRFRFTMYYLGILGILLVLLGFGIYYSLSGSLHKNLDEKLKARAKQIARYRDAVSIISGGTFEEEPGEHVAFFFYSGENLRFISHRGLPPPLDRNQVEQALRGRDSLKDETLRNSVKLRVYIMPYTPDNPYIRPARFYRPDPGEAYTEVRTAALMVARPVADIENTLAQLRNVLLILCPLIFIISGAGGLFLAERAFKPVDKITETTMQIQEKNLGKRIPVYSNDEFGKLASAINQMFERLEKAFNRQKQFTSDASHELRAPVAIIQAESTLALEKDRTGEEYRQSLENIAQESERMSGLLNQLLTLARADSGKEQIRFSPVLLEPFLQNLCSDIDILCREKDITLTTDLQNNITINGNEGSLRRLFHNLIDNAIRHTPEKGSIKVTLTTEGKTAVISVSDNGSGIPPSEIPMIFERFYRADKARTREDGGSGLGLAICKHITELHKGRIEAESTPGKGSIFRVKMPLS
ncbi:MAG: HAMP domain-containing histidine kinase [Firmicutes bacterium]|nr:HAMP domain-containing histidine kinase [Bacillota bacterium]